MEVLFGGRCIPSAGRSTNHRFKPFPGGSVGFGTGFPLNATATLYFPATIQI